MHLDPYSVFHMFLELFRVCGKSRYGRAKRGAKRSVLSASHCIAQGRGPWTVHMRQHAPSKLRTSASHWPTSSVHMTTRLRRRSSRKRENASLCFSCGLISVHLQAETADPLFYVPGAGRCVRYKPGCDAQPVVSGF